MRGSFTWYGGRKALKLNPTAKYGNHKTEYDGIEFASRKEANRYAELKILEQAGEIKDLKIQEKFVLVPTQREPDTIGARGGVKKGKVIEQEVSYIADFVYADVKTGEMVVEDVKGYKQSDVGAYKVFVIKRKLMLYVHGIRIKEV